MNKTNNYTTIDEAKKLVSVGFDTDTADMHYIATLTYADGREAKSLRYLPILKPYRNANTKPLGKVTYACEPCWGMTALLEVFPEYVDKVFKSKKKNVTIRYYLGSDVKGQLMYECTENDSDLPSKANKHLVQFDESNWRNAIFKMACWLGENKYIEKEVNTPN